MSQYIVLIYTRESDLPFSILGGAGEIERLVRDLSDAAYGHGASRYAYPGQWNEEQERKRRDAARVALLAAVERLTLALTGATKEMLYQAQRAERLTRERADAEASINVWMAAANAAEAACERAESEVERRTAERDEYRGREEPHADEALAKSAVTVSASGSAAVPLGGAGEIERLVSPLDEELKAAAIQYASRPNEPFYQREYDWPRLLRAALNLAGASVERLTAERDEYRRRWLAVIGANAETFEIRATVAKVPVPDHLKTQRKTWFYAVVSIHSRNLQVGVNGWTRAAALEDALKELTRMIKFKELT